MSILVSDVMTKQVRSVEPDLPLLELERILVQSGVGGAPVVRAGALVGVVSRTDVVRRLLAAQEFREYAESEHHRTISPFDVPLSDLWSTAQRTLNPAIESQLSALRVADVMSEHPITVTADTSLELAGQILVEHGIHRVIVVDGPKPVGILSSLDIVRCYCGPVP
jgi:CBS domain-containing protein